MLLIRGLLSNFVVLIRRNKLRVAPLDLTTQTSLTAQAISHLIASFFPDDERRAEKSCVRF